MKNLINFFEKHNKYLERERHWNGYFDGSIFTDLVQSIKLNSKNEIKIMIEAQYLLNFKMKVFNSNSLLRNNPNDINNTLNLFEFLTIQNIQPEKKSLLEKLICEHLMYVDISKSVLNFYGNEFSIVTFQNNSPHVVSGNVDVYIYEENNFMNYGLYSYESY